MMACVTCGDEIFQSAKEEKQTLQAAKVNKQGPYCSLCFHLEFALRHADLRKLETVSEHIKVAQLMMPKP